MSSKPLHTHSDTHLYHGSFDDLVASQLNTGLDILVAGVDEDTLTDLKSTIQTALGSHVGSIETAVHDDEGELDLPQDSYDFAIGYQENASLFKRHKPLYALTEVIRSGGTILYRAPCYLPHSTLSSIDTLYVLNWSDNGDPEIAALLTVKETMSLSDF